MSLASAILIGSSKPEEGQQSDMRSIFTLEIVTSL